MTFWLFSGWLQKSGDAMACSMRASSVCLVRGSKIAPHSFGLLAERLVFSLEFV